MAVGLVVFGGRGALAPGRDGRDRVAAIRPCQGQWTMPPIALLARPKQSAGRRVAMLAIEGYLLIAIVLLIVGRSVPGAKAHRQGRRQPCPGRPLRSLSRSIPRYTRAELAEAWSDHARFEAMREVEVAACEEMEGPTDEELDAIRAATFTVEAIDEREKVTDHDTAAFVDVLAASAGPRGAGSTTA